MAVDMEHPPWPQPNQHLWSDWWQKTGLPKVTWFRTCLHPDCDAVEYKEG